MSSFLPPLFFLSVSLSLSLTHRHTHTRHIHTCALSHNLFVHCCSPPLSPANDQPPGLAGDWQLAFFKSLLPNVNVTFGAGVGVGLAGGMASRPAQQAQLWQQGQQAGTDTAAGEQQQQQQTDLYQRQLYQQQAQQQQPPQALLNLFRESEQATAQQQQQQQPQQSRFFMEPPGLTPSPPAHSSSPAVAQLFAYQQLPAHSPMYTQYRQPMMQPPAGLTPSSSRLSSQFLMQKPAGLDYAQQPSQAQQPQQSPQNSQYNLFGPASPSSDLSSPLPPLSSPAQTTQAPPPGYGFMAADSSMPLTHAQILARQMQQQQQQAHVQPSYMLSR